MMSTTKHSTSPRSDRTSPSPAPKDSSDDRLIAVVKKETDVAEREKEVAKREEAVAACEEGWEIPNSDHSDDSDGDEDDELHHLTVELAELLDKMLAAEPSTKFRQNTCYRLRRAKKAIKAVVKALGGIMEDEAKEEAKQDTKDGKRRFSKVGKYSEEYTIEEGPDDESDVVVKQEEDEKTMIDCEGLSEDYTKPWVD